MQQKKQQVEPPLERPLPFGEAQMQHRLRTNNLETGHNEATCVSTGGFQQQPMPGGFCSEDRRFWGRMCEENIPNPHLYLHVNIGPRKSG